jgi:RNA polymerase sigma factor (sigma-70 family)
MLIASGLGQAPLGDRRVAPAAPAPGTWLDHLGCELRALYGALPEARPSEHLMALIAQIDGLIPDRTEAAADFQNGLLAVIPGLRAFALSLVTDPARAEDLVQETVLKAWTKQEQFVAGTNLKAWLCTILRNQFYSECRKHKREVEDADGALASRLATPAVQEHGMDLQKVWDVMATLPASQREALLLVGAQGMTYEAAAAVMGCQTGTMKSRVSRARATLAEALSGPGKPMPGARHDGRGCGGARLGGWRAQGRPVAAASPR